MNRNVEHGRSEGAFRNDAYEKVTGRARYADDFPFPGGVHCVPVYSDYVHARIVSISTENAEKMPGAVRVFTWKDVPGSLMFGQINQDLPLFSYDKIRSTGDVIALVAAESREQALEAAKGVTLEAEELTPVLDPEEGMKDGSPLLFDERGTNIVAHHKVRRGNAREALKNCDIVIEETFTTGFFEHAYLEPEGAFCIPRPDGTLEIYGSIQHPNSTQKFVSAYLGVPLSRVEVVSHPAGGSFGGKDDTASVVAARAALAAMILNRPAKLIYDREWSMRESYKRPAYRLSYQMGLSKSGEIKAVACRGVADSGAYTSTVPWSTWRATVQSCGPYRVEHVHTDIYGVATNNLFTGAFRGFGSPQINFSVEQLMDIAAERCGVSPVEIRRKNMVRQGSETITGQVLDNHTVSMEQVMDTVLDTIGYDEKAGACSGGVHEDRRGGCTAKGGNRRRPLGSAALPVRDGEEYGVGFAISYRGTSIGAEGKDFCACTVNCLFDGSIVLETGVWENGQGAQSAMMIVLSRELGVSLGRIRYARSTTLHVPDSGTTVASRGTLLGSGAVCDAASKLKSIIARTVAPRLGCTPGEVEFRDDRVFKGGGSAGPASGGGAVSGNKNDGESSLSWDEAMAEMYSARVYPYALGSFKPPEIWWDEEEGRGVPYFSYVYSCQAVEVAVDRESGEIRLLNIVAAHDIGKAVNLPYLKGQVYGGILQGAGMALLEDFRTEAGRVVSDNYNRYKIPKAEGFPDITVAVVENPDPTSPHGCKGIGEPALEIIAPAIANAVYAATGTRYTTLPFGRRK